MAGSNAYAAPAAVIALLRTALAAAFPTSPDLEVTYSPDAQNWPRECVYGGQIRGPHDPHAMRGGGRRTRAEQLTWALVLRIARPDCDPGENAQRALEIGAAIEEALAAGTTQDGLGVAGLKKIEVVGFTMENFQDDDARFTEVIYSVGFTSILN